jgi:hypothetical protein
MHIDPDNAYGHYRYLARTHDPAPGNIVMWRGLSRLTDLQLGFAIGANFVGN